MPINHINHTNHSSDFRSCGIKTPTTAGKFFYPFSATKISGRDALIKSENTVFYALFSRNFFAGFAYFFCGFHVFFCVKYAVVLPVAGCRA